jgi:hypothetical protein
MAKSRPRKNSIQADVPTSIIVEPFPNLAKLDAPPKCPQSRPPTGAFRLREPQDESLGDAEASRILSLGEQLGGPHAAVTLDRCEHRAPRLALPTPSPCLPGRWSCTASRPEYRSSSHRDP